LATLSYRRRRWVVASWVVLLVTLTLGSKAFGGHWMTTMTPPNTDSAQAATSLQRGFPAHAGDTGTAVIAIPASAAAPQTAQRVNHFVAALRHIHGLAGVAPPLVARAGTVEVIPFTFTGVGTHTHPAAAQAKVLANFERHHGLDVELSGLMFDHFALGNQ